MKSVLLRLTLVLALAGVGSAQAAEPEAPHLSALLKAATFDTARAEQYLRELQELQLRENAGIATAAAPPLSYLQVYAVISSQYPQYEYLATNQYVTQFDHGGAEMYVVTVELGYGATWWAQINGGTQLTRLQTQTITDSSNVVIGFYHWWIANGYQSGQFTYQNTSQNSPFNTMYDWVSIL